MGSLTHARAAAGLIAGGVTAFSPAVAAACPKCYGASSPQVLSSYYLSTLMLTLLPFAVLGTIAAIGWHFKRRAESARAVCAEPLPCDNSPSSVLTQ